MIPQTVTFLPGGLAEDARGQVSFVNEFPFQEFKRFYTITNHEFGFVRAWHGHKFESKAYFVVSGAVQVGAVKIDDWSNPSPDCDVVTHILDAGKPGVLFIPGGYANGFKSLTQDAKVIIFSNFTLEESLNDDYRFEPFYWNPWQSEL